MVGEWVDRHRDTLVMVAMRRVRDGDEAEDVVQDATITAMALVRSDPERLREIDDPRGWLVGITLNIARNTWKTRCRREGIRRKRQSEIREELFPVRPTPKGMWKDSPSGPWRLPKRFFAPNSLRSFEGCYTESPMPSSPGKDRSHEPRCGGTVAERSVACRNTSQQLPRSVHRRIRDIGHLKDRGDTESQFLLQPQPPRHSSSQSSYRYWRIQPTA